MKNRIKPYLLKFAIALVSICIAFALGIAIASSRVPLY